MLDLKFIWTKNLFLGKIVLNSWVWWKYVQKANDVYSHSVTLFKCGGTGWTRTSLRFVTNRKNKESFNFCRTMHKIFFKEEKSGLLFQKVASMQMKGQTFAAFAAHRFLRLVLSVSSKHVVDRPSALHCLEYVSSSIFSPISPCKQTIFSAIFTC